MKPAEPVKLVGAHALGGPVAGGKSYLVDECDPEIFTPRLSGAITTKKTLNSFTSAGQALFLIDAMQLPATRQPGNPASRLAGVAGAPGLAGIVPRMIAQDGRLGVVGVAGMALSGLGGVVSAVGGAAGLGGTGIGGAVGAAGAPASIATVMRAAEPITLAGARALGGPVSGGRSYLVGERGPEIFTPGLSGAVSTNGTLNNLSRRCCNGVTFRMRPKRSRRERGPALASGHVAVRRRAIAAGRSRSRHRRDVRPALPHQGSRALARGPCLA